MIITFSALPYHVGTVSNVGLMTDETVVDVSSMHLGAKRGDSIKQFSYTTPPYTSFFIVCVLQKRGLYRGVVY